jgi:hypothetical protein
VVAFDEGEVRVFRIFHGVRVGLRKRRPPGGGHPPGGVWRAAGIARRAVARGIKHLRAPPSLRGGLSAGRSQSPRFNIMGVIRTTRRNPLRIKHLRRACVCASVPERVLIARP